MEGLYLLMHLVPTGDWMIKIDLKDAYFTLPVTTSTPCMEAWDTNFLASPLGWGLPLAFLQSF